MLKQVQHDVSQKYKIVILQLLIVNRQLLIVN